ncbi:uncharacterized protein LOC120672103 [Panicum virgatum]|uniref:Uncharacterized protein n=1 Tax=Panicum virgatum TaxID=38727 RepID=A0A8T0RS97_PANVG|nr:uncharacterized protein LOC120672103 [Panicum virgatum]KAG2587379.1 hypothetical protein PVAP13_5NG333800 [Panicum virgatum]
MESKVPSLPAMYVMLMTMIILAIAVSFSCPVVGHCTEVKAAHDAGDEAVAHPDGGRRSWGPPPPHGGTLRRPYKGRQPVRPPPPLAPPAHGKVIGVGRSG